MAADPLPNDTDEFFVKTFVLPALESMLNQLFSGLKIPPLKLAGISLSPPSVAITDGHVVAAANLEGKGRPAPPGTGTWTGAELSMLMSQAAFQAAVASQSTSAQCSDHKGKKPWYYVWYTASYSVGQPSLSIQGTHVKIQFSLKGEIGAGARY